MSRYTQHDFIELVDRYNIAWHEKTLGQLFCNQSASQIVEMLLAECSNKNCTVKLSCNISAVKKENELFHVETSLRSFKAASLVIATGGQSIPKMGATDYAYKLAKQFGLKIIEPRPALVPFTLSGEETLFKELSGVATPIIAKNEKASFEEAALFTHKGLSGPAILQISSYWRHGEEICIDFLRGLQKDSLLDQKNTKPKATLLSCLSTALPERLAKALVMRIAQTENVDTPLSTVSNAKIQSLQNRLNNWIFSPNGTEGFAKAEVTIGGISTDELSSKTMEAKKVKGLYVIGEAVDVTGWLGGYNFQWAWSSGWIAGNSI